MRTSFIIISFGTFDFWIELQGEKSTWQWNGATPDPHALPLSIWFFLTLKSRGKDCVYYTVWITITITVYVVLTHMHTEKHTFTL